MTAVKKRSKPEPIIIPLPLVYNKAEAKPYVKQHWNITFARQKKVSIYAMRIIANVLSMIKDDECEFRSHYQMHVSDVVPDNDSDMYERVKSAFSELMDFKWLIEDLKTKRFAFRHVLDTTKSKKNDGFECGYDNGTITIVLNPQLKPYFFQLGHYSIYQLEQFINLRSFYSQKLFSILSAFHDTGVWRVSIEEFRLIMDCEDKYPKVAELLTYVLAEPTKELEHTDVAFRCEPIQDKNSHGRGRKPVVALEFRLKSVLVTGIPDYWFGKSEAQDRTLHRLLEFKVTPKNIGKYMEAIDIAGANKLIHAWQVKGTEIRNKEMYCNVAWVKAGEKAIEAQKQLLQ